MKPFPASLERVLEFRRRKLETAEAKLKQTRLQQTALENRVLSTREHSVELRKNLLSQQAISGGTLNAIQKNLDMMEVRIEQAMLAADRLEEQKAREIESVQEARREVQVLERLKQRRDNTFRRYLIRKEELEAADRFLVRFARHETKS